MARLRTRLEALMDVILAGKLNSDVKLYLALALHLSFVADEVDANVLGRVLPDLLKPAGEVLKGFRARNIVSEENTMGSSIEDASDRLKGLLAGLISEKTEK